MTPQEASNLFNKEFQKALKETVFPDENLPKGDLCRHGTFEDWKLGTLQYESPMSMGMSVEEFGQVVNKTGGYTLFEFAQISNSLEKRTAKTLHQSLDNYVAMQREIVDAGNKWQEIVAPIRKSVEKKIEIMAGVPNRNKSLKLIPQA